MEEVLSKTKTRADSVALVNKDQRRPFARLAPRQCSTLVNSRNEHANTYVEGTNSQTRELEINCLKTYEEITELCSWPNLKKDVESVVCSIDNKINELIGFLNDFRTGLRANMLRNIKTPLTESDYQRFEQLKVDITTLTPQLSLGKFKDKQFGPQFDNYLQKIKEFNSFATKAKRKYNEQLNAVREIQRKIDTLVANARFSFDIFSAVTQSDHQPSLEAIDERDDALFWNPETLEVTKTVNIELSSILKGACFIAEEKMLALGGMTEIALFEWPTLNHIHTSLLCHQQQIIRLIYSSVLKKLVSCSSDRTVKLWNLNERTLEVYKEYQHPGAVYAVEVMEESQKIIVTGEFSSIYIWNLLDDSNKVIQENFRAPIFAIKYINYSKSLAVANSNDGSIWIYSLIDLTCRAKLAGHTRGKAIWSLDYHPQKDLLYSAGSDGIVSIWAGQNAKNFALKRKLTHKQQNLTEICTACAEEKIIALSCDESESSLLVSSGKNENPTVVIDFPNLAASVMLHDPQRKELILAANGFDGTCTLFVIRQKEGMSTQKL